jgi:Skp family chaperone for outer membrane proteins
MRIRLHRFLSSLLIVILAVGLCPARSDDAEMVKEKLFQAKKDYDAQLQKFKKSITDLLDKREDDARMKGNKKQVDQIKAERDAFEKTGESPQAIPSALREPVASARTKLDKAYTAAIKEYVRLKMDDAAGATEKEQQEFILSSALMLGKKTYLTSLKHSDVKVLKNWFANDGTCGEIGQAKVKVNGEIVPHSIFMHIPEMDFAQVRYSLEGKWTVFHATIGDVKFRDDQTDPFSAMTFEVLGDDKSLWKSEPVTKLNAFQKCTVNIAKVKTLTLRVHCKDNNGWGCSFWIEPILAE